MRRVTALAAVIAVIFAVTPIQMLAASPVLTGDIRGVVLDPAGRQLASGLRVQLINSRGIAVVGKAATVASDTGRRVELSSWATKQYSAQAVGDQLVGLWRSCAADSAS